LKSKVESGLAVKPKDLGKAKEKVPSPTPEPVGTYQDFKPFVVSVGTQVEMRFFEWKAGQPPTKMIHKLEGACFIVSITGALNGYGEAAEAFVSKDDGHWYLHGKFHPAHGLEVRAVAMIFNKK
jgi:hypothetical protein